MRHGDGSVGEDERIVFISTGSETQRAELRRQVSRFSSFLNLQPFWAWKPLGHAQGRSYVVDSGGCVRLTKGLILPHYRIWSQIYLSIHPLVHHPSVYFVLGRNQALYKTLNAMLVKTHWHRFIIVITIYYIEIHEYINYINIGENLLCPDSLIHTNGNSLGLKGQRWKVKTFHLINTSKYRKRNN